MKQMSSRSPSDGPQPFVRASASSSPEVQLRDLFVQNFESLVRALWTLDDDAADVVQEAFGEAHRQWERVGSYDDPLAWIRRVAVNKSVDRARRRQTERQFLSRVGDSYMESRADPTADRLDVRTAIRKLPPRQRLAVVLYYLADLSVEQVADAMSVSAGAVKAALSAGRKNLVPLLEVRDGKD